MIVVDASVLVKLVSQEPGSREAAALVFADDARLAPDWAFIEVANALSRKTREGMLPVAAVHAGVDALPTFLTDIFATAPLLDDALTLSIRIGHPLYDCFYLALAMAEDARLITADLKFGAACTGCDPSLPVDVLHF